MNTTKFLNVLLLSILFCSTIPLSVGLTPSANFSSVSTSSFEPEVVPPAPEPPHSILPVYILVYTQYADTSPGGEYENTMTAINNTYGTDYYHTSLTDYTDLASELPHHDILLVVEQELATAGQMQTVGTAWATTLTSFVQDGGIVILMDYAMNPWPGYVGVTFHIYNSSGLMQINGVSDEALTTIYLTNTSDALARHVSSSWTAPDGSMSFDTPETTVVVDNSTHPVVVHKIMDKGHVVLLGFDLYSSHPNCEELLGNAIRLHRHVVFDASHSPYGTIFTDLSSFADDLVIEGFAVSSMGDFSPAFIDACDVLVLTSGTVTLTAAEANAIEAFVLDGGGLFVATDWGSYGDELDPVTTLFGFTRNTTDYLTDTDDTIAGDSYNVYDNTGGNYNIVNHSITLGVTRLELDRPGGFSALPTDAFPILYTDTDGTSDWHAGSPADGIPVAAALVTTGNGRVSAIMDWNFLDDGTNPDSDGDVNYYDSNNDDYAINTIRWLSAAGLKERVVLFEESHNPISSILGLYLQFGKYLTSNGYTVRWMTTFHTTLIDEAHILYICDGNIVYSVAEIAAIRTFVETGGGLYLITDYQTAGDRTEPIGIEFGIYRNDTSYLVDSDDYDGGNTSFIVFNSTNFGVHPIMQEVSSIEVYTTTGFDAIGTASVLVSTDTDGTCTWNNGGVANGLPIMVATEFVLGRVVVVCDLNFNEGGDWDGDGTPALLDRDNNLFIVNAFQWLSENRAPIVNVTSPNGAETLTGTVSVSWTAIDPNNDPITSYDVYYSDNNGGSWNNIATGLTTTSTNWDTTSVSDGDQYLIRVVAHDYELNGQDQSDAVFSVDNVTPTPTPPPIPGFPFEAIALGLLFSLGLVFVVRRRRRHTS